MRTVLFLIVVLPLFFCKEFKSRENAHRINNTDSIIKDIPKYKDGGFSVFYREKIEIAKALNLYDLEAGFDSLQIRIWYPEWTIRRVLILSKYPDHWEGTLQKFESKLYKEDKNTARTEFKNLSSEKVSPRSQWSTLISKLVDLDILNLPDSYSLPGSPGAGTDGISYSVEIGTNHKYRFYFPSNPFQNQHIVQVKKMAQIIEILNQEFPEVIE